MRPDALLLLGCAAASLAVALTLRAAPRYRMGTAVRGVIGLVGLGVIAAAPSLELAVLVLAALGLLHAAFVRAERFAAAVRAPLFASGLIGLALLLFHVTGPDQLSRFAVIGLVAGLMAAIGLLPFLHELDPAQPVIASPVVWIAFAGPVLAPAVIDMARTIVPVALWGVFASILIGLGVLNMVWGALAAWATEEPVAAWRYSFIADWGLALCGFGLTLADGRAAAVLVLFGVVLCRFPLYLVSREALRTRVLDDRPLNLVVAAALAGSAPFVGFAARVLLLRSATDLYWPLAFVLAAAMLLWLPGSLRLGRSLGQPRGRQAVVIAVVLGLNLAVGLYPQPVLSLAGL